MINYEEQKAKYAKLGKTVPTKEMIKTLEQIEGIRQAGIINTKILDEV